jgi:tetratricopeptide (TPR) repeat protein
LALGAACAQAQDPAEAARRASLCLTPAGFDGAPRLLAGMGEYSWPLPGVTPQVQRWFNQGLVLAWGFNFSAAEASFREAARLDPACALCWWGVAYAAGPSVNHDMSADDRARAAEAMARAQALAPAQDARSRALIAASALRYAEPSQADRSAQDAAYAQALARLARARPEDADLATLWAEALMVPNGRDYWRKDGRPQPWTEEILRVLQAALRAAPDHPGANHLYVHALEDAPAARVTAALDSAQRLARVAPGAGHLVHMPAHVYFRLGRYDEAVAANRAALDSDRAQFGASPASAAYVSGYTDHNRHFLWASALMAGDGALAAAEAQTLARDAGTQGAGTAEHLRALPLYTAWRFGRWEALASAPRPQPHHAYTDAVWRLARAMAALRQGELSAAQRELAAAERDLEVVQRKGGRLKNTHGLPQLAGLARYLVAAELAQVEGRRDEALRHARAAVLAEDALDFDEPPAWQLPARQVLGALLLEDGRAAEAAQVFRADLAQHPDNPWAAQGLATSLRVQGEARAAAKAQSAAQRGWRGSGSPPPNSRY